MAGRAGNAAAKQGSLFGAMLTVSWQTGAAVQNGSSGAAATCKPATFCVQQ
jgi:hypothetical protein